MEIKKNISSEKDRDRSVGVRLRAWRKSSAMKITEMARKIGISQSSLSDLENGNSLPSAATLVKLCAITDIDVYWLLIGQGTMTRRRFLHTSEPVLDCGAFPPQQAETLDILIEKLVKLHRHGEKEKVAYLKGFLDGAVPH